MKPDDPATPCGLVAKSYFNDEFSLKVKGGEAVTLDEKNIAWKSDIQYKFNNVKEKVDKDGNKTPLKWKDVQWIDMKENGKYNDKFFIFKLRNIVL